MPSFVQRTRFATLLGVMVSLLIVGTAVGAAGSALILGAANSAGTSNTSLTTSTTGTAFLVTQNGTGTALRGVAGVGIAGFFTSANGAGVSGVVANANNFGVYAANDSASTGTGAALRAAGKNNYAVVATSDDKPPIKVVGPTGMAPFEVNSAVAVTNLNADLLDGLHGNYLTRFAYNTIDNDARVGSSGVVISTTITAPTRGWLHITASSDVFGSAADSGTCNLDVGNTNIAASFREIEGDGGANSEEDCSTNAGYFTCGGALTVSLEASGVAATTTYDEATIEVTFHPYDGSGNRPSLIPCLIVFTPERGWTEAN